MMTLWISLAFAGGLLIGGFVWAYIVASDESLVRLGEDELIIKRPNPNMVLVSVSPDVARRLINYGDPDPKAAAPTEARSLYPERALRSKRATGPANDAMQDEDDE